MPQQPAPKFAVISGAQVHRALDGREQEVVDLVERTYLAHGSGNTVNPPSYFLRFPDRPSARIIALPASLGDTSGLAGLKWISSFPANVSAGLPRASAILVLNDRETGYPYACLESSIISAARTAASAVLAADWLSRPRGRPAVAGFCGTGLIARYVHTYLATTGWSFDEVGLYDVAGEHAQGFRSYLEHSGEAKIVVHGTARELIQACDLVVFATVAAEPHVTEPNWFAHNPLVLHVSLRDLSTEVILASANVVDDVDHCLRANTSLHLAEQATGGHDFLLGTLPEVLAGHVIAPAHRPLVFSPFGLGVLDLAVGGYVYEQVARSNQLLLVDDFFHELRRYG